MPHGLLGGPGLSPDVLHGALLLYAILMAVTWLLDRNVDQGRGAKLAFTDTVSELTYGDL